MAVIDITRILLLRGESADLPVKLDDAQMAYTTDDGRLFIGFSGDFDIQNRTIHPFKNIEILTENSTELFADLHGNRMKEGGGLDYYTSSRLTPTGDQWAPVKVLRDDTWYDYTIPFIDSVTAFIDYAAYTNEGYGIRFGKLTLRHYLDNEAEPFLEDECVVPVHVIDVPDVPDENAWEEPTPLAVIDFINEEYTIGGTPVSLNSMITLDSGTEIIAQGWHSTTDAYLSSYATGDFLDILKTNNGSKTYVMELQSNRPYLSFAYSSYWIGLETDGSSNNFSAEFSGNIGAVDVYDYNGSGDLWSGEQFVHDGYPVKIAFTIDIENNQYRMAFNGFPVQTADMGSPAALIDGNIYFTTELMTTWHFIKVYDGAVSNEDLLYLSNHPPIAGFTTEIVDNLIGGGGPGAYPYVSITTSPNKLYSTLNPTHGTFGDTGSVISRFATIVNERGNFDLKEILVSTDTPDIYFGSAAFIDNSRNAYITNIGTTKTYKYDADGAFSQLGTTNDLPLNYPHSGDSTEMLFSLSGLFSVNNVEYLIYFAGASYGYSNPFYQGRVLIYTRPCDGSSAPTLHDPLGVLPGDTIDLTGFVQDGNGDVWVVGKLTDTSIIFWHLLGNNSTPYHIVTGMPSIPVSLDYISLSMPAYHNGKFYLQWDVITNGFTLRNGPRYFIEIDATTFTITKSVDLYALVYPTRIQPPTQYEPNDLYYVNLMTEFPPIDTKRNHLVFTEYGNNNDSATRRLDLQTFTLVTTPVDGWYDRLPYTDWTTLPPSVTTLDPDDGITNPFPLFSTWHDPIDGIWAVTANTDTYGLYATDFAFLFIDTVDQPQPHAPSIDLRLAVRGTLTAPVLRLEYKHQYSGEMHLRFKTSRPQSFFIERGVRKDAVGRIIAAIHFSSNIPTVTLRVPTMDVIVSMAATGSTSNVFGSVVENVVISSSCLMLTITTPAGAVGKSIQVSSSGSGLTGALVLLSSSIIAGVGVGGTVSDSIIVSSTIDGLV